MAIIQSLRRVGRAADFYNIDYFRPQHEEIAAYFSENQFDMVGISAVVSTSYKYTQYLAGLIRSVSPDAVIVVGGNLAASAEILLRKCEVDFCVVGDGELIIQDLVKVLKEKTWTYDHMKAIGGLCFLDESGKFHFTNYRKPIPGDAIEWPDYSILEADGSLPHFIEDHPYWMKTYGFEIPQEMYGKRSATIITTKGCVARCTFCHRWEKGYRVRTVEQVIEHIQYLKDRYNVGFIAIGDENFGSNRKLTRELVDHLGQMGILWRASGVRARTVDLETLEHWKANGCRMVLYGIESGSQTMLDVMEKNTDVQMNIDALKWTHQVGLFSVVQLVIGMPGETDRTIDETIDFLKKCMPTLNAFRGLPGSSQSINYAQALPGTPLYEYARQHGFIGSTLDDEERYLVRISDTNAYTTDHFINYTRQPMLKVHMWVHRISGVLNADYICDVMGIKLSASQVITAISLTLLRKLLGKLAPKSRMIIRTSIDRAIDKKYALNIDGTNFEKNVEDDTGYLNLRGFTAEGLFFSHSIRRWSYPWLAFLVAIRNGGSLFSGLKLIVDHIQWSLTRRFRPMPNLPEKTLRKTVTINPAEESEQGGEMMIPLRLGR